MKTGPERTPAVRGGLWLAPEHQLGRAAQGVVSPGQQSRLPTVLPAVLGAGAARSLGGTWGCLADRGPVHGMPDRRRVALAQGREVSAVGLVARGLNLADDRT